MAENQVIDPQRIEALGPAERVVQAVSTFTDHLVHNRPGFVVPDARTNIGVRWTQATWRKQEDGSKVVFTVSKGVGAKAKNVETRVGILGEDGITVLEGGRKVGEYRKPGIFPEVAVYLYRQVAEVFKLDAEFAAHWASWTFAQDRRDLKTVLAAFMLSQKHAGEPVVENGEVLFHDDDFRSVGEAMLLIRQKGAELAPKQVLLVGKMLRLPQIHALNLELGFTRSAKNPQIRRYKKAVSKWLAYREENRKMLTGLAKSGQSGIVQDLARLVGYKPASSEFFRALGWSQKQSQDGRREVGLDLVIERKETWEGKTEAEICGIIVAEKLGWKVLVGRLPSSIGLTRAIVAAAVEAGSLSDKDLIILTPTLEELGMLTVEPVATRWREACARAEDQRSRNIARNVRTKEVKEALEEAADVATAKAIEEVTRNLRVYFIVDKSGSMEGALESAKQVLGKFLGGFPLDRTHVSVFNTLGSEVVIKAPRSAAVAHAFEKHMAGGGTEYSEGVRALAHHKPKDDEDTLFVFIGDGAGESGLKLSTAIEASGLRPTGFIWGQFQGSGRWGQGTLGTTIRDAATRLGIPCVTRTQKEFEQIFDDPYAVTNTLKHLIATTPVGVAPVARQVRRETLVEQILKTPLLTIPLGF